MKKSVKKLSLYRESVLRLDRPQLQPVAGALIRSDNTHCTQCTCQTCFC
jgi:hypothetical protein